MLPRGVVKVHSENPLKETISSFDSRKWLQMCPCLGMEPYFHFPFSMSEHPSDLNLCMLVCIAAVSAGSCSSVSLFSWNHLYLWPLVSFCILFWLAPWNLRESFHEAFIHGLSITKPHTPSTLFVNFCVNSVSHKNRVHCVGCLRHWSLCVVVCHQK